MQDRVAFYKEMLLIDPMSKIFYSLSLSLRESGNIQEAIEYLEKGLLYHPDFLEARILLVDMLAVAELTHKKDQELNRVIETLLKYPHFWNAWAEKEADSNSNVALSIGFIAHAMNKENLTWTEVLSAGMQALSAKKNSAHIPQEGITSMSALRIPPSDAEYEEVYEENSPAEAIIHTRSMADLLAEQGEIEEALGMYRVLANRETNTEMKAELDYIIAEFETRLEVESTLVSPTASESVPQNTMKEKLIGTLANLVERLDARADSIHI